MNEDPKNEFILNELRNGSNITPKEFTYETLEPSRQSFDFYEKIVDQFLYFLDDSKKEYISLGVLGNFYGFKLDF